MEQLKDCLLEGISLSKVLENLKDREKQFQDGMTFHQRGEIIRRLFPDIYNSSLENAENCLKGLTILPGCATLHFIGNPVKWHENLFDYDEYTYQLNRMDHWRTMAEAYSFTGDLRFAKKIIEEFYHWVEDCKRQPLYHTSGELAVEDFDGCKCNQGIWRSLEAGIRMYRTWPYVIHHLLDSGLLDEDFLETYLLSAYEHAQVLYLVAPKLWPNADHNHYLMENNGLLYLSCMFPEFKEAALWKEHAIHQMERSMKAQVTRGGGQIEGCASYHNGCTYWFALPLLLSEKYGFSMSEEYKTGLRTMIEYSAHATRPCGGNCSWGDSNTYGGTLSMGAFCCYLAFQDSRYLEWAHYYYDFETLSQVIGKYIWETQDFHHLYSHLEKIRHVKTQPQLPTLSWQKELKQVFMRTDWTSDALYLMFACRTPIQNNHAHIDPAGFEFSAYGSVLLGDPAIYYYKDDENRKHLKSAHWHNCLTLNHQNPWEYISSWEYGEQKHGDILFAEETDQLSYAVAEHENYQPAIHKRCVAIVRRKFLVILDFLTNVEPDTSVQINFHLDVPAALSNSELNLVHSVTDKANIAVFSDGSMKPHVIPAKISTKNDVWHDTQIARFEKDHLEGGNHVFAHIGVPSKAGEKVEFVNDIKHVTDSQGKTTLEFRFGDEVCRLEFYRDRVLLLS